MKTVFYLIRHGESQANRQNRLCGHADWDLTELGQEQARRTAQLFRDIPVDAVLSSDLLRALHTAQAVADLKGLTVQTDPGFREIFVGPWEGQLETDVIAREPEVLAAWRRELRHVPGGESIGELYARVKAALDRAAIRYAGCSVVVATHATPIRLLMCAFSGRPLEEAAQIQPVSNASVTKILWDGTAYQLVDTAADDHLGEITTRTLNTI